MQKLSCQSSWSESRGGKHKGCSTLLGNPKGAQHPQLMIEKKEAGSVSGSERSTNLHQFSLWMFLSGFKERWKLWVKDLTVKIPRLMRDIHTIGAEEWDSDWWRHNQIVYLLPYSFNRKKITFSSRISLGLWAHRNVATLSNRHWWRNFLCSHWIFYFCSTAHY